jgi:hypothetical protein
MLHGGQACFAPVICLGCEVDVVLAFTEIFQ